MRADSTCSASRTRAALVGVHPVDARLAAGDHAVDDLLALAGPARHRRGGAELHVVGVGDDAERRSQSSGSCSSGSVSVGQHAVPIRARAHGGMMGAWPDFVLLFGYSDPDLRARVRPRHLDYVGALHDRGQVVSAGPFEDGSGALIVYEAADEARPRRWSTPTRTPSRA